MPKFPKFTVRLKPGILMCLFFTVSFNLLGYTMALSIFLGVIGGLAFSLVITWWNNPEIPPPKVEETATNIGQQNQQKFNAQESPQNLEAKAKSLNKNNPQAVTLLNWLFRPKG